MQKKIKHQKSQKTLDKAIVSGVVLNTDRNKNLGRILTTRYLKRRMKKMTSIVTDTAIIDKVVNSFARTTDEIISLGELKKMLFSGRQLRMKFGVDVTAPDLHIGHAVNLWMYRKLQELGHKIVFLIGDFTTQIGDPTGKSKTRPIISIEEIQRNAEAFIKQALMILHDDSNLVEIRRNSEWYDKMPAKKLLSLMSLMTHDRLMTRDMFRKRSQEGKEIYEHELVYPILQGYDSIMLKADLTIIGSDQLYNEMMGRFLQEKFEQMPQVIITTKITPGIDGKEKQSKSLGNYIGLVHSPREKFGRIMSMADNLIIGYLKVYTEISLEEIAQIEKNLPLDPMKYKLRLAKEIVKRYHGEDAAEKEIQWFKKTFSERQIPKDTPTITIGKGAMDIFQILRRCFTEKEKSNNEIRRLIIQKAVSIDGKTVDNIKEIIKISKGEIKLKVGKRRWFIIKT